jgi:N-acetylmuramoyl-L-alanine amidase
LKILYAVLVSLIFYLTGCTTVNYYTISYDTPVEFKDTLVYQKLINTSKNYLAGKRFFIDPGHGGSDRVNKGPKELAIEADVNLRVALNLRNFLTEAGAIVIMSREKDTTVALIDRSIMANNSRADLFISIHHNSPGASGDPNTNYTSTYYHAKESDYEYEPMEKDVARFIQRDMAYAMRNSGGLGSFDGTYSDYLIYPKKGFAVLRNTEIPSVLVECSFHSHPVEEQRLIIDEFNKIQAWGIFRGLYRYYRTGYPEIKFVEKETSDNKYYQLFYKLNDSSGIDEKSIRVFIDSLEIKTYSFDSTQSILQINIDRELKSDVEIRIIAANIYGNHTHPFRDKLFLITSKK